MNELYPSCGVQVLVDREELPPHLEGQPPKTNASKIKSCACHVNKEIISIERNS